MARATPTFDQLRQFELIGRFFGLVRHGLNGSLSISFDDSAKVVNLLWHRPDDQIVAKRVTLSSIIFNRDIIGEFARKIRIDLRESANPRKESSPC